VLSMGILTSSEKEHHVTPNHDSRGMSTVS
jgi:hypothetical protein